MGFWKKVFITAVAGPVAPLFLSSDENKEVSGGDVVGAVLGGGFGLAGLTCKLLTKAHDAQREKDRQIGREEGAAAAEIKIKKMEKLIESMHSSMQEANEHYQFIIALAAVGMAAANTVGNATEESKENIEEFITGLAKSKLPQKVKAKINDYKENPPTLSQAIIEVRKLPNIAPNQFRDVILLALNDADTGELSSTGRKFITAWEQEIAN